MIEVNDNPNIDHGYEDGVLKDKIYEIIMRVFRKRIDQRKGGNLAAAPHFRPASVGVTH